MTVNIVGLDTGTVLELSYVQLTCHGGTLQSPREGITKDGGDDIRTDDL